jgi:two-component system nitrogen regulation sensor histidine kinase GlnL
VSLLENLWSHLPLPAVVISAVDEISAINSAAESFLGAGAAHIIGRNAGEMFGGESRAMELLRQARIRGVNASDHGVEFLWPKRAPEIIDLMAAVGDDGEVLLILQPRSIARSIDRTLTHRSAARSVAGMAAMLAHEIKNPLAGISGAAQLLEMNAGDDDRQLTVLIREECTRIEKLVNGFESFGDNRPPVRQPINIHDVLDRAKRAAEAGFGSHVRFYEDYDPSLPPVPGDPDQLMQVFQNLLKNAAEAAPKVGGVITLKSAYQPGVAMTGLNGARVSVPLMVQISDNGSGVPADLQADLFEPFVSTKTTGAGLGLSLVAKIVADHGGAIECVSSPGWTTFRLRLPILREGVAP